MTKCIKNNEINVKLHISHTIVNKNTPYNTIPNIIVVTSDNNKKHTNT